MIRIFSSSLYLIKLFFLVHIFIICFLKLGATSKYNSKNGNINSGSSHSNLHLLPIYLKHYDFSGEEFPSKFIQLKKRLSLEIYKFSKNKNFWKILIHRSEFYFPIASSILKHYSVPDDFKYLLFTESYLNNTTSPKGAVGYWQILKSTASDFGLSTIKKKMIERILLNPLILLVGI